MSWFYEQNGQRVGPVEEAEIFRLRNARRLLGESLIWKEGLENWVSFDQAFAEGILSRPEAAAAGGHVVLAQTRPHLVAGPKPDPVEAIESFDVNIGGLLGRTFKFIFGEHFWPLFGAYLLASLLISASGAVAGALWAAYPILGGFALYKLHILRGQRRDIADIFLGFKRNFGQLAILNVVVMGLMMLMFFVAYLVILGGFFLSVPFEDLEASSGPSATITPDQIAVAIHPVAWVGAGLMLIFIVLIWYISLVTIFSVPLCIDRMMGWKESLLVSLRTVHRNFGKMLLLTIVLGLISASGLIACYIGVLFTAMIPSIAITLLYEDLWGPPTVDGNPLPDSRGGN